MIVAIKALVVVVVVLVVSRACDGKTSSTCNVGTFRSVVVSSVGTTFSVVVLLVPPIPKLLSNSCTGLVPS